MGSSINESDLSPIYETLFADTLKLYCVVGTRSMIVAIVSEVLAIRLVKLL